MRHPQAYSLPIVFPLHFRFNKPISILQIPVTHILTHESPDLDAIMSVLLMRNFGEEKFPGASTAEILFASAGELPEGKSPAELEKEGILAVDIGGGRFDTHPVGTKVNVRKLDRAATDLVAEELGVIDHPFWKRLIEYTRRHDSRGHSLISKDPLHHLIAIHSILLGLQISYEQDSMQKLLKGMEILRTIPVFMEFKGRQEFDQVEAIGKALARYIEEEIGEEKQNYHQNFFEWYKWFQENPAEAFPKSKLDEIVSIRAIFVGAYFQNDQDEEAAYQCLKICLDAILERERIWFDALAEFDAKAKVTTINEVDVVSIASANGMVIKAARFRTQGDIIIYRNPENGATSILVRRKGRLQNFSVHNLIAKIRIAESVETGTDADYNDLREFGMVEGWFLHQSGNFLVKGSPKAPNFIPSKISMEDLERVVITELDWDRALPLKYNEVYFKYRISVRKQK